MDPRMNNSPSILIMVRWEEEELPLTIPASTTIMQLKVLIWQRIDRIAIAADRQDLYLENGALLSDEMSVQHCGIANGSVLIVVKKIAVTIKVADDRSLELVVDEDVTVGTLKGYLVFYHVDIENKALQMSYEGNDVVLDDRSYLWAAGIVEGTSLSLVRA
uniref:uncharacterized protein LOC105353431 n=1 Tax=Fragaria vesca subsp. vesca TaxID=101020 RepID=UPI0005C9043E|nr:PREDICTED: uncharacterized protein LOC105353431 [Fragaria vesca subsp. vesca]